MRFLSAISFLLLWSVLLVLGSFRPVPPVPQRTPSWVVEHDTLLSIVKQFGLRPEYPTIFSFTLEEGDSVFFEIPNFAYLIDRRDVTFRWISPTESSLIDTELLKLGTSIRYSGDYRLEISAKKKLSLNQKAFDRLEDMTVHRYRQKRRDAYAPSVWVEGSNLYIGDEADKGNVSNPEFRLFVAKGDSLALVFSGVDEALPSDLLVEIGLEGSSNPVPHYVDASGLLSLPKFIRSGQYLITLKTTANRPFYKSDQDFFNLSGQRIPQPLRKTSTSGAFVIGEEEVPEASEEEGQPKSAAELLLEEYLKGQTFEDIMVVDGQAFTLNIPGKMQLNGTSRTCRPLSIPASDVMVYWLGVGSNAMDEYRSIDTYQKEINANPRDAGDIMTRYARSVLIKENPRDNLFRGETESTAFDEYVEFVIVNEAGKQEFLAGKTFSKNLTNEDHGHTTSVPEQDLYLCLCNHNRVSNVQVSFKYALFNRYTE